MGKYAAITVKEFQEQFLLLHANLKSYLFRLAANQQDAEDLAHDTYIKALKNLSSFAGEILDGRVAPRAAFQTFRHNLWWDWLDLLYFAGHASWNYFTTPFLLAMAGVETKEIEPWQENGETWQRLAVNFPETIPTHCREQVFYFDDRLRLRRFDYAPEVYASWAKAAHYCSEYENFSGLLIPTKRYVVPRAPNGRSRSKPTLVWIEIKEIRLE